MAWIRHTIIPVRVYDQHLFTEKGIRGGIYMVSKRHAKANNPRIDGYDLNKPKSHIMYLDANNLYGWAMSQQLPTCNSAAANDTKEL